MLDQARVSVEEIVRVLVDPGEEAAIVHTRIDDRRFAGVSAKRRRMGLEIVDGYLLGEAVSKPDVVAALLADRDDAPAAAPFYRALEAVGARAADEAFLALRLVLAGRTADDAAVKRLRALASVARAARTGDAAGLAALRRREREQLVDLPAVDGPALAEAARAAYRRELEPSGDA
jgi:hypothetical protein